MRRPYRINPDWSWRTRLHYRLWNATIVRIDVLALPWLRSGPIPRRYGFAYSPWHSAAHRYVLRPFHLLARFWHWYVGQGRWCIEKALMGAGVLTLPEGDYYWNVEWSPPGEWQANRDALRSGWWTDLERRKYGFDGRPGVWGRFWRAAA